MSPNPRIIVAAAAVALAAAGGTWACRSHGEARHPTLFGNVDIREVNLAFRTGGRVADIKVDEGDPVKAGDLIASLDPEPLRDAVANAEAAVAASGAHAALLHRGYRSEDVEQARARLEAARAALKEAEEQLVRQQAMVPSGAAPQRTLDSAVSQRDQAAAQVRTAEQSLRELTAGYRKEEIAEADGQLRQAQASLESARLSLRDAQLIAPSDGVILTRAVEKGSMVAAGTPGFSLTLTSPVWARAYVSETELGRFNSGTRVHPEHRPAPGQALPRGRGLRFAHLRIHPQERGDLRPAHLPGLPPAHRGAGCRRPAAPGHAGHRPAGPMNPDAVIEVRGLVKRFPGAPAPALDQVTTAMRAGTITGLVGPDGAGKTTFLRTLAGLLKPTGGEVRVLGLDPQGQSAELREQIGYMPQKFGLYEDLSVLENLTLYADLRNVVGPEREAAFKRLLAFTDLAGFTGRYAGKLSGGMKQKLGPGLLPAGPPPGAAPGRTRGRGGSHLPARTVEDGPGPVPGRPDRGLEHRLPGRGRAVRRRAPDGRRPHPGQRRTAGAHGAHGRTLLPDHPPGRQPEKPPAPGAERAGSDRRRHPGQLRCAWSCAKPASSRTWRAWGPGPRPDSGPCPRAWRTPSSACWAAAPGATRPWPR